LKVSPGHAVILEGPTGPPLGVLGDQIFPSIKFRFSLGDILILVTDGISDVLSGAFDPLGERGLTRLVADVRDVPGHGCVFTIDLPRMIETNSPPG
jgi:serine phosphatase RsbU (regulator of sigma subunit)